MHSPNAGKPFYGMTYYLNFAEYNLNNPIDFAIVEHSKDLRIYVLNRLTPVHRYSITRITPYNKLFFPEEQTVPDRTLVRLWD